jgi:hypothetical protein
LFALFYLRDEQILTTFENADITDAKKSLLSEWVALAVHVGVGRSLRPLTDESTDSWIPWQN